jgi:hypothetical protein
MFAKPWTPAMGWRSPNRRSVVAPINPLSLTSLRAWYKSDVGTTIATGVSQWNDQSGNLNHLVQAVGASQPALTAGAINGLPALVFDGSNDFMSVAFVLVQPSTVFFVMRPIVITASRTYVDGGAVADTMAVAQAQLTPNRLRMTAGSVLTGATGIVAGVPGLVTAIFNGASSALASTDDAGITGNAGAGAGAGLTVGSQFGGTLPANMQLAEVIVMAAMATAGERAGVRSYVQQRYAF